MARMWWVSDEIGINLDKVSYWDWNPKQVSLVVYFDHSVAGYSEDVGEENEIHAVTAFYAFGGDDALKLKLKLSKMMAEEMG